MELLFKPYQLEYKFPFGVSSNTRTHTQSIFVKINWDGFEGHGEACIPPYLGETLEESLLFFEKAKPILKQQSYPCSIAEIIMELDELDNKCNAAKAAIDIALHDLKGKIENKTVSELYRLHTKEEFATACTIGIDAEEILKQKISDASDFSILKIKAGTSDDKALINLIRKYTDKPLFVDVNQGWKDKYMAVDMIAWMKQQNVLLVEQPMPINMLEEMGWVTENSQLPTIADESAKRLADIDKIKGAFTGINIKLMKCTGIKEAFQMAELAKQYELKIFLGCMAESTCATSAMAQLITCADFIDLDAPHLLKNDPFTGISYKNGKIILPNVPGIGVQPKSELLNF